MIEISEHFKEADQRMLIAEKAASGSDQAINIAYVKCPCQERARKFLRIDTGIDGIPGISARSREIRSDNSHRFVMASIGSIEMTCVNESVWHECMSYLLPSTTGYDCRGRCF